MRILVVEDEKTLREQLNDQLEKAGYAVSVAADGKEGLYYGMEYAIDLAVVDLGLPGMSGIALIQQLRDNGRVFPILILTARSRWQDKVSGLEAGGDDYLVKPFHLEELLARIKALIRRAGGWSQPVLSAGPINLDISSQEVRVYGNTVKLTAYEYKILEYLMMHRGEVVSKTVLTEHIYQQDFDRDSNVIEVLMGRLRRKLALKNEHNLIETLRGRGYRFVADDETNQKMP